MTNPVRIEDSRNKRTFLSKIAKIAEFFHQLYLGPYLKILKMLKRNTIYIGSILHMNNTVDIMFKKVSMNKEVVLSIGKLNALKYRIICSHDMITKAFTDRTI